MLCIVHQISAMKEKEISLSHTHTPQRQRYSQKKCRKFVHSCPNHNEVKQRLKKNTPERQYLQKCRIKDNFKKNDIYSRYITLV